MVDHDRQLTVVFSALADPTRRRILEMLKEGERRVTDLARPFRMTLAAVSKHLRVLERAGLLTRHRDGRVHRLRANPQKLAEARAWIEEYARAWDANFDALDRLLAERHGTPRDEARPDPDPNPPRGETP